MNPDPLLTWIQRREAIRELKESGAPFPWTDDPVLRDARFCNVRREDDRVTIWIREFVRDIYADHEHLWFMLAICRWINWPDTLDDLITSLQAWPGDARGFTLQQLGSALQARADRKEKVWTGAYTINAPSIKGTSKISYVVNDVLGSVWRHREQFAGYLDGKGSQPPTLRGTYERLSGSGRYRGWGPFMTHQVIADLRYTRYLRGAPDVGVWTVAGPGSTRGLNRLLGRKLDATMDQGTFLRHIKTLRDEIRDSLGLDLEASDVQGCLCETDKYLRVQQGGQTRAKYVPGRGW